MNLIDTNRGLLGVVEFSSIGFSPQRLFWISDVPHGSIRGAHAHRECLQYVVVQRGRIEYRTHDLSDNEETGSLSQGEALFVDKMTWLELSQFQEGAVVAVLASMPYDETDYIRNWEAFNRLITRND